MDRRQPRSAGYVDTLPEEDNEEEFVSEAEEEDSEEEEAEGEEGSEEEEEEEGSEEVEWEDEEESEEVEWEDEEEEDSEEEAGEEEATNIPDRVSQTLSSQLGGEIREDAVKRGRDMRTDGVGVAHIVEGSEGINREETDGLFCPICMEAWSNGGEHYPSCLPCGHLYGMSCIKKWFHMRRSCNKCPQCNAKCLIKDVRRIYGSQVLVHDHELLKRIRFLEKKDAEWCLKELDWLKRNADLCSQLHREEQSREINTQQSSESLFPLSYQDACDAGLGSAAAQFCNEIRVPRRLNAWEERLERKISSFLEEARNKFSSLNARMDAQERYMEETRNNISSLKARMDVQERYMEEIRRNSASPSNPRA